MRNDYITPGGAGELLRVCERYDGGGVMLRVCGDVDLASAGRLQARLLDSVNVATRYPDVAAHVVVDLRNVGFLAAAGVRALVEADARARSRGAVLRVVVGASSLAAKVLRIADLERVLKVVYVR